MPFDNQGTYTRAKTWQSNNTIDATEHNTEDNDFATALNQTFLRNGIVAMSNNLKMNNNKIVDIADGSSSKDAANYGQLLAIQIALQSLINTKLDASKFQVRQSLPSNPDPDTYYFIIG